ncbi:Tight junction protein ZO-1 [Thelohanellus kitauei]|uniref:Tight junction protein ZO-1 n=1 Tax=Thelohanellus kitauei TaxID=669202 RepID=A0A0C2M5C0_THEKT|nr:Tight junction protein ZO-1 [Thelohanellus kitauei]
MKINDTDSCEPQNPTNNYKELKFKLKKGAKGFGLYLGNLVFVKDKVPGSAAENSNISLGDIILTINDVPVESCKSTDEVLSLIKKSGKKINLGVIRPEASWLPRPLAQKTTYVTKADEYSDMINQRFTVPITGPHRVIECSKTESSDFDNKFTSSRNMHEDHSPETLSTRDRSLSISSHLIFGFSGCRYESQLARTTKHNRPERRSAKIQKCHRQEEIQQTESDYISSRSSLCPETRHIKIRNCGTHLGLQLIGGNKYGIFVSSLMSSSPAANSGLRIGDQILSVNDHDFTCMTREEAVLHMLAVKNENVFITCVSRSATYEKIKFQQCDEFFIRVNFDYLRPTNEKELSLRRGELLMVRDTMFGGTIGSWSAVKVFVNGQLGERGIIPNKTRAEQLAIKAKLDEKTNRELKKRLRPGKFNSMKTKAEYHSQDKLDRGSFNDDKMQIPAYQVVVKQKADFKRPVIIIGHACDVFRDFLKMRIPQEFEVLCGTDSSNFDSSSRIGHSPIKLSQIQSVIDNRKHCLLDISFQGVEVLHHANLAPIIVCIKLTERKSASLFRTAAVNMVYGKNKDTKSKREVRYMNKYASKFQTKYPLYITSYLEVLDNPVDHVFVELVNIIRSRQEDEIYLSSDRFDQKQMETVVMTDQYCESGYTTNESEVESETESLALEMPDEKVFRQNKFESTDSQFSSRYTGETSTDRGKVLDIKYVEDDSVSQLRATSTNSMGSKRVSSLYEAQKAANSEKNSLELSLNTVLKIPTDGRGGLTESPATKFSVYVPPGALPTNKAKEIFFKLYLPKRMRSNALVSEDETVVVCGPEGVNFLRPIEVRMPFNEKYNESIESRMYTAVDINANSANWKKISLNYPGSNGNTFKIANNMTAILLDRF